MTKVLKQVKLSSQQIGWQQREQGLGFELCMLIIAKIIGKAVTDH
jgi:hypothetical protein